MQKSYIKGTNSLDILEKEHLSYKPAYFYVNRLNTDKH